jgi:hypothetical protein
MDSTTTTPMRMEESSSSNSSSTNGAILYDASPDPGHNVTSVHKKKQMNNGKSLAEITSTNTVLSKRTTVNITRNSNTNTDVPAELKEHCHILNDDVDAVVVVDAEPCVSKLSSSSVVLPSPIPLLPTTGPLHTPKYKIGTTVLKARWIVCVLLVIVFVIWMTYFRCMGIFP